jgi:SAM-dependent methyltransferase
MYRLTDYGWMLRDPRRIDAYTRSLTAVITNDSIVADLGTGIGTFAIIAARLAAARVYAIEAADVIEVAKANARQNGVADRIRFIHGDVLRAELPERVHVVVSDLAGALPLFDQHLPSVIHAREHFLAPDGVLIPAHDRLFCAPVTSEELHSQIVDVWRSVPEIDLSAAEQGALNSTHNLVVEPRHLLEQPRMWGEIDYLRVTSPDVRGSVDWQIENAGRIFGFALWFESRFDDRVVVTSGPWSPGSVHATIVLPLAEPLDVHAGDDLRVTIECILAAGRYVTTWHASTSRESGTRQSTFFAEQCAIGDSKARTDARQMTDPIADHSGWTIDDDVLSQRLGEELILLNLRAGTYHVLNETGTRVWEALQRGHSFADIAAAIANDYDVSLDRATRDVAAVLGSLAEARLIRQEGSP